MAPQRHVSGVCVLLMLGGPDGSGQITCAGETVSTDAAFALTLPLKNSPDARCVMAEIITLYNEGS